VCPIQFDTIQKHGQLRVGQLEGNVTILRPAVTTGLQPLGANPQATSIPEEHLEAIARPVAEHEQMSAGWVLAKHLFNQAKEAVESHSHVGDTRTKKDTCVWVQREHNSMSC